jgi:hypothetical protein
MFLYMVVFSSSSLWASARGVLVFWRAFLTLLAVINLFEKTEERYLVKQEVKKSFLPRIILMSV